MGVSTMLEAWSGRTPYSSLDNISITLSLFWVGEMTYFSLLKKLLTYGLQYLEISKHKNFKVIY
jgi:hypothetical protein